jgi:hypothetical protein
LVPIFINLIPVSLATDAYPIAIAASYLLHSYCGVLREVLEQSDLLKVSKLRAPKRRAKILGVVVEARDGDMRLSILLKSHSHNRHHYYYIHM